MCTPDIFLGLLAILFPPLPVWVKCGICSADSVINILLCTLGYLPGLLHTWYIIAKFPDPPYEEPQYHRVPEDGRVYVFVEDPGRREPAREEHAQPKPQPQGGMNYGTASHDGNASPSSSTAAQAGSSTGNQHEPAPPTYAEAVRGDNKVQTS